MRTPWRASPRRLVRQVATKSGTDEDDQEGDEEVGHRPPPCHQAVRRSATKADAPRRRRTAGPRCSLSRATSDSTVPTATATPRGQRDVRRRGEPRSGRVERVHEGRDERRADGELHRAPSTGAPRARARVIEDHHLVDHRQLEVRRRVVDRHARRLDLHDDEERDERSRGLSRPGPGRASPSASSSAKDARPVAAASAPEREEERRLERAPRTSPRGSRPSPRTSCRCRARASIRATRPSPQT